MNRVAFLTWSSHRRTTELAAALEIALLEVITRRRGLSRYAILSGRTLWLLRRRPFDVIVAQSPSLVLAVVLVCVRPLLRFHLVLDAHNEAITPFIHDGPLIRTVSRWVVKRSQLTIVSNPELAARVLEARGRPFVLPDPLPSVPGGLSTVPVEPHYIAVVCTFAPDEPLEQIFQAAGRLPQLRFRVTGDSRRCPQPLRGAQPRNVELTGFLDDAGYWQLLAGSCAVLDLTMMPDCLVCGAYEALALGIPMILSNNAATRRLFHECAVFAGTTVDSIVAAITEVLTTPRVRTLTAARAYAAGWQASMLELRSRLLDVGAA